MVKKHFRKDSGVNIRVIFMEECHQLVLTKYIQHQNPVSITHWTLAGSIPVGDEGGGQGGELVRGRDTYKQKL